MRLKLGTRRSAITFDAGRAGIRACQVRGGRGVSTCETLCVGLPMVGAIDETETGARLARMVGQADFEGRDVSLVLSPPTTRFFTLKVPDKALTQDERQVQQALQFEVARELRSDPGALETRFWRLPEGNRAGFNVMAVALETQRTLAWLSPLQAAGLMLRRIDVSPCALTRLALQMRAAEPDALWGVLDLGCGEANLTVVLGDTPVYVRTLTVSSRDWTARLARSLDVAPAAAETIKRRYGVSLEERGVRETGPSVAQLSDEELAQVVFGVLRDPLEHLVADIGRCMAYILENYTGLRVSHMVLAGGASRLRGLREFLELQLSVPVDMLATSNEAGAAWARPLPGEITPEAAIAIGGALLDWEGA